MSKERKKNAKINIKVVISLLLGLTAFSTIFFITMAEVSKHSKGNQETLKKQSLINVNKDTTKASTDSVASKILAVVKDVQKDRSIITLYDINSNQDMELSYYGGSDVRDKFGEIKSISQIPMGAMVEVEYIKDSSKLLRLQISAKAWEYVGVNNLYINRKEKMMEIVSSKYRYTDDIIIVDGEDFVSVENLAEQDELTIRGLDEVIWSVTVTRGHGTVRLTDCEALIGGYVTVGYEAMLPITEDMVIPVREGSYNMTVENGDYSATVDVTIYRNQQTEVSLKGLGPEPVQYSNVTFNITPFGADLYIDGELTTYGSPVVMTYGNHNIKVSLGGYVTYEGNLIVDKADSMIYIDLPEVSRDNEVSNPDSERDDNNEYQNQDPDPSEIEQDDEFIIDEDHSIYVQTPKNASVYLNGEFRGISPISFDKVIGKHILTFIQDGYETKSYSIEVANDGKDSYFNFSELIKIDY